MDVLTSLTNVIVPQYLHISKDHIISYKYIQLLFVSNIKN